MLAALAAFLLLNATAPRVVGAISGQSPLLQGDSWLGSVMRVGQPRALFQRGITISDSAHGLESLPPRPLAPPTAMLASALIPGAAQIRGRQLRGYVMLGAELGAVFAYRSLHSGGKERQASSESMARSAFSLSGYRDSALALGANPDSVQSNVRELEQLFADSPNDYYEYIGKRGDLSYGWSDFQRAAGHAGGSSDEQRRYALRREDGNRLLKHANTLLSGVLLNHLVSAFDAYRTARNYERDVPLGFRMKLNMDPLAHRYGVRFARHMW